MDEHLGRKKLEMPVPAVLDACRAYAQKYVDLQTSQFERIGCFGRWNKPYKTMARDYEAHILEAFYGFLEKGFVYRGLKPVYWCIHDRTALAEAEVEYDMHTSPSVYVRYKLTSDPATIAAELAGREVYTIIWTTTPWTLPASLAVAFHPISSTWRWKRPAAIPAARRRQFISLPPSWPSKRRKRASSAPQRNWPASRAASSNTPPISIRSWTAAFWGVLATYVTADTGTGAVHTAPAHGADDFYTGVRYGLDPTCRVDAAGHVHVNPAAWNRATPPAFEGLKVWAANPVIIAMLEESGALLGSQDLNHSYPHCWRCTSR